MIVTAFTDPGLRHGENQDFYLAGRLSDDTYWAVLCDGMGGGTDGGEASRIAAETFGCAVCERVPDILSDEGIKDFIIETANRCNSLIYERSKNSSENPVMMGTTIVCVIVRGGVAHIASSGDSRAYHINRSGIRQITKDHSIVQELLDCGKITAEQARNHPNKNIITSALGVDEVLRIDSYEVRLFKDDALLLCSDGLSNMLTHAEIEKIVRDEDFYACAEAMVKKSVEAGGYDNITAIVLKA